MGISGVHSGRIGIYMGTTQGLATLGSGLAAADPLGQAEAVFVAMAELMAIAAG